MMYEVSILKEALDASDLPHQIESDPEEWDRFVAEFVVNFWHTQGFRLTSDTGISPDD
jgi:hypothetical protein